MLILYVILNLVKDLVCRSNNIASGIRFFAELRMTVFVELVCVLTINPHNNDHFAIIFSGIDNFMPINTAPCRDVIQRTGVGAGDGEGVTGMEFVDPVLGLDDRHRA